MPWPVRSLFDEERGTLNWFIARTANAASKIQHSVNDIGTVALRKK